VKALAQPTKQAFLYVFDRVTGKPVFGLEERAVEKGDVQFAVCSNNNSQNNFRLKSGSGRWRVLENLRR